MMVPSGPACPHVVYSTLVCVGTMYTAYVQPLALTGILAQCRTYNQQCQQFFGKIRIMATELLSL